MSEYRLMGGGVMFHCYDCEYVNVRRIVYGEVGSEWEGATFVPVCVRCHRFVKPDESMRFRNETIAPGPNATCSKCGRTEMHFEGFISRAAGKGG
jgi:hypothetical protein